MKYVAQVFFPAFVLSVIPISVRASDVFGNPLASVVIQKILHGFIFSVIYVGTPAVIVAFVFTGFLFASTGGDPKRRTTAKDMLIKTLIAGVGLFSLWTVVQLIGNTLAGLTTIALLLVFGVFIAYISTRK